MTEKLIGPTLPADFAKNQGTEENPSRENYGPALPPHLRTKKENLDESKEESHNVDNFDVIGPILPGSSASTSSVQEALEERAQELKYKFLLGQLDDSTEEPKRESWMTELPPEKAQHLGLGPRKFKKNYNDNSQSSRSAWTETPADRKKKDTEVVEEAAPDSDFFETASTRKRNEIMDEIVEKSKKHKKNKKSLSLVELHQKKLKKKMKKKSKKDEKSERRPFDRDVDLQVHRFDEAQKKAILKKAQLLNTRFSAGKSKYL